MVGKVRDVRGNAVLEDVVAQENGLPRLSTGLVLPGDGEVSEIPVTGKYNALLGLRAISGFATVTLTTTRRLPPGKPSTAYLELIARGVAESLGHIDGETSSGHHPGDEERC